MWSNLPDSTKWTVAIILALIGGFFMFMTYGALITSKKHDTHISGVPFVGAIFVFLGFILSPIKWLAFLALLDPGIWMVPVGIIKKKNRETEKTGYRVRSFTMGIGTLKDNLRKHSAVLLSGLMLLTVTACNKPDGTSDTTASDVTTSATTTQTGTFGFEDEPEENTSEYIVDNEDQAQKVINCSHRNLFGLEKMVLFENRMVAVFDKDTCDKSDSFLRKGNKGIEYIWFSFNNLSSIQPEFDVTQDKDKYILDASCQYEESDLIDPSREVKITGFYVKGEHEGFNVNIYADDLEISLSEENHDSHTMYYDASEKTWSDVTTEIYRQDDSGTDGIDISYDLDLVFGQEQTVYDYDGVTYQVNSYNHELSILVHNTSTETKTIGGTRYLQRINGDDLIDLSRSFRESTYAGTKVKDMPAARIWILGSTDPNQPWQRTPDPLFTLYENETIEIEPGQSLYVEILVMDFYMEHDGIYRLTFGEAELDFELEWEMIW